MVNSQTDSVFGPDSAIWQISRELVLLLGGPCAAILQVAHPQVALGVKHHSRFREDAFGRLYRTLEAVYTVAFGTRTEAERLKERIAAIHRRVQGSDPAKYSAFSPDAQMWVLATLIQTALEVHERFLHPLPDSLKAEYFHEMKRFGEYFGLERTFGPQTWPEFQTYYQDMLHGPLLASRPECREVARAVALPRGNWLETAAALPIQFLVTEILPSPVREKLGFRSTPFNRGLAAMGEKLLPILVPRLPAPLRFPRQYREALRRFSQ
ncbi:MAG TPA: oxygenase MpaB family protein [Chthoniobacterales bacterium]